MDTAVFAHALFGGTTMYSEMFRVSYVDTVVKCHAWGIYKKLCKIFYTAFVGKKGLSVLLG